MDQSSKNISRACSVDNCTRSVKARGWCQQHYLDWRLSGEVPTRELRRHFGHLSLEDRILSYTKFSDGCHIWTSNVSDGYGSITIDGRQHRVHRVTYELKYDLIGPNMVLDHLCLNKLCHNPEHLEEVTQEENLRRMRHNKMLADKLINI